MRYKWNLRSKYKDGRVVITPFTTSKNVDHVRYVAIEHYIEHSGIQSIEISKFLKSGERYQGEIVFKQWNPGKLECFWVKNGLKGRLNRNGTLRK